MGVGWHSLRLAAVVVLTAAMNAGPVTAAGQGSADGTPPAPPPVRISADEAEYFNTTGLVVFTGKVVAVQGDSTLTSDRMEVLFTPQETREGQGAGSVDAAESRRIAAITATGNVSFRQLDPETKKERFATGEKAVYDDGRRTVTMTGAPRLWEGKNVILGEEMIFQLDEKRVLVKGKVNLTVYPEETKKAPDSR